ncbi:hypothetical protein [Conexibacter arvalis]|uniref:Uncharacterized protein n=1 Tax=Conexibacter arvalis TaxID=912552 RepID=A0A840I8H3_9ACTN|nr:hypothetical protein [Conexibacter arvalis]MBB4660454.1 hypothetical protein [Conexibacter arvalis]
MREFILEHFQLLAVVSLPASAFAHYGAGVKASIVFVRTLRPCGPRHDRFARPVRRFHPISRHGQRRPDPADGQPSRRRLGLDRLEVHDSGRETTPCRPLDKGDVLFDRTNSKELVGKSAVFCEEAQARTEARSLKLAAEGAWEREAAVR